MAEREVWVTERRVSKRAKWLPRERPAPRLSKGAAMRFMRIWCRWYLNASHEYRVVRYVPSE